MQKPEILSCNLVACTASATAVASAPLIPAIAVVCGGIAVSAW